MAHPKLDTRGVHRFDKDKRSNRWYLASIHPIQWFVNEDARIAVQNGLVYTGAGEVIPRKDQPQWFVDALAKLTPEHRASLGIKDTTPKAS